MDILCAPRRYVAGVDGGGTKTACMIADESGTLLAYAVTEGSNHQISGFSLAIENVCRAVDVACDKAGIQRETLSLIYLGMAGADSRADFQLLNDGFAAAFGGFPFKVVNDVWIAFACEVRQGWGAVSVCGTGANLAIKDPEGKVYSVRALRYILGNYGGGYHLAEIALHHAFRCDEHTGPDTRLAEILPRYCDCADMDELAQRVYQSGYQYYKNYNIPKLVFDLGRQGDKVCRDILVEMGTQLGTMLGYLICHAGLKEEKVPVVLAGSQYAKDSHRLIIGPLEEALRKYVPAVSLHVVQCPPVVGAVLGALDEIGAETDSVRCQQLKQQALKLFV